MSALEGTGSLIRLALRLDRVKLAAWVLGLTAVIASTASAFEGLYPTVAEREAFGATIAANPALRAVLGSIFDASSIGGLTAWRVGVIASVLAGLMGLQTVVRHTRTEEEAGRLELVRAGVVGRHAPLAAALVVALGAGLMLGALSAGMLIGLGEEGAGSLAFGLQLAGAGWMFAAVGALAAQLTVGARAANGIAGATLGAAYLLRAVGDATGGDEPWWTSWISPIGWTQQLRAFGDERWWLVAVIVAFTVVVTGVGVAIAARRDLDAGVFAARIGPDRAAPTLASPYALAWRLQRGLLAGWVVAVAVWSSLVGTMGEAVGDLVDDNAALAEIIVQLGGQQAIIDALFAAMLGVLGLGAAAYAIQAALRLRGEEIAQRAEPVLATRVRRVPWAASHLLFAVAGPVVLLGIGGATMGLVHGSQTGDVAAALPELVGGALVQLPAVWVLAGVTLALFGLLPQFTPTVWAALVACLLLGQLGQVLQLDQWLINLSPFTHVPQLPGADLAWTPLLWLTAVAVALGATGLVGFRHRDVGSAS